MASSSYNQNPSSGWDVFLNFHGPDTRYFFTSHLYSALDRQGLLTFKDDPKPRTADVIPDESLKAIKEAKSCIVVLSENYASSAWCLDQLVQIVSLGRLVIPVYYNIDPQVVRHQTKSFQRAFKKHRSCFDVKRLNEWRSALTNLTNLSGCHLRKNMYQADIINQVVDRVLLEIKPMTLHVANYPVGLESRVEEINALLNSDTEGVIRIGIYGMGGVGKTTLAKAVYNQNYHRFQGSCFLANVREVSGTETGLVCLQQQLINDVLKYRNIDIDNVDHGIMLIRARICSIKVLIVIDDLEDLKPLEYLEGPFASGSTIIITTRNEDLLDEAEVEARYKVKELDDAESLQLFTRHAFRDNVITGTLKEVSNIIFRHAGGLPLALKVFGSNLLNQSEEGWRWFVDALKQGSITEIDKKLLISYDALEYPMLQDIFLDISCFFIGWEEEEAVKILETYYGSVSFYIVMLKKRCLLTINNTNKLEMHDLLRDMGRTIARNNSLHEPGKHSRLWVPKDIRDVLQHQKGTDAVQGIISSNFKFQNASEEVLLTTETFKMMSKLRFLYLERANLTGSFERKFENLRWLCWDSCPLTCLPSDFYPQKLVILALPHSKLKTIWNLNMVSHVFEKLTTLDMSYSLELTRTPDFAILPCLQTLNLEGCESLEEVHISIGSLVSLVFLNLCGCVNLRSLPDTICMLRALKSLNIGGCSNLDALPTDLGNIESLTLLNARGPTVSKLPESVGCVSELVEEKVSDDEYHKTPSSSASTSPPIHYDVFLSFCGTDTRYNFTRHLYAALIHHGIRTYMVNELSSGEVISDALLQIIQTSKIYIVVFSENYASSCWRLDELVEILNFHKTFQRLVVPVFCRIDPSVVRNQTGSYKKAFKKHQIHVGGETKKLNKWHITLAEVAGLLGYHISENRCEAEIIDEIVHMISPEVKPKTLYVAKYPVGLDSRVRDITELLSSNTEGVTKIGLYGMGGVGKTTLAKSLYNQLLQEGRFRGSCFLGSVREVSRTAEGLVSLQQQLIGDVLKIKEKIAVDSVEEGTMFIRDRICSEKVLVLIDDINDPKQYKSLEGPFAAGSVVIITTRDEEILDSIEVDPRYRYRVNELDEGESLALFNKHAFGNAKPDNTLEVLSAAILHLASGLPLALVVFGDSLTNQPKEEWKIFIDKMQKGPNTSIKEKLMISLDAIELEDPMLKNIFLDIACFFIAREKEEVIKILETYYWNVDHYIDILKKRCLLEVNDRDELVMHHMLRDMGREIACNNYPGEPGKQNRLWLSKDIWDVLREHEGTEEIEGIIPRSLYYKDELEGESFSTETFKRMRKLRFLYLKKVKLTGIFEQIFQDLRWLCWDYCPLKCLPSEFNPQKLVILELPHSNMRTMWEPNMVPHVFENLKTLNMSYSLNLITTPDFTKVPCLETLNLKFCENLEVVHISIGRLASLVSIDLHGCVKLKSLPESICYLKALKVLSIGQCCSLEALPTKLGNMESLEEIYAQELTVSELPDSVGSLCNLIGLRLSFNENLETLPDTIYNLRSLESLDLGFCRHLLSITELPSKLKWISAVGCRSMEILPNLSNLKQLEDLDLTDCSGLTEIRGLEELTSIRKLGLGGCNSYLLEYTLTKHFFKIYSGFGHEIIIFTEFPYWINQSSNFGSAVSINLLPNVSCNFLGTIICFKPIENSFITYCVKNPTSGFIWSSNLYNGYHISLMVIVPRSTFSAIDGDGEDRIELKADVEICGIHVMYKHEDDSTILNEELWLKHN